MLHCLQTLEVTIKEKQGPPGNISYPKGKEVMMSVVKRLRRQLLGPAQQEQQQRQQAGGRGVRAGGTGSALMASVRASSLLLSCAVLSLEGDAKQLSR